MVKIKLQKSTKINSRWTKDLNIRSDTIKLLEENIRKKLLDIDIDNDFVFYSTPKAQTTKTKIKKWAYIKLKSFCTAKKQPTKWNRENICRPCV